MGNNCSVTKFAEGAALLNPTVINPEVTGGTFTNPTVNGGVTFDAATAQAVADQICAYMKDCVSALINDGTFTNVTLEDAVIKTSELVNATLSGVVKLDDAAKVSLATQLCSSLSLCIIKTVQENGLFGTTMTNTVLDGTLQLSEEAANTILSALESDIEGIFSSAWDQAIKTVTPDDIGAVAQEGGKATGLQIYGGSASEVTFSGSTLNNSEGKNNVFTETVLTESTTIRGQVPLDTDALAHLCAQLSNCIAAVVSDVIDEDDIAAVFQDCTGVPRSPNTRIPSCDDMQDAIDNALSEFPALGLLDNVTYNPDDHTLTITIEMADGSEKEIVINLDSLGGQVAVDNVTVGGTGTSDDPLYVIAKESTNIASPTTGTDMPTSIYGSRGGLLGAPVKWLNFNGYMIPAYNQAVQK